MRLLPRISLTAHGLVELIAGLALTVAAFLLDLGGLGTVLVFVTGVSLAGIGLTAAETLPLSAHQALDRSVVMIVAGAAVVAAASDSVLAASLLLGTAATVLVLELATRWSRPLGVR